MPIYVERPHPSLVRSSFVDLPRMEELEAYLDWTVEQMSEWESGALFALMDLRRAATPPLEHLKRHAAFFRERAALIERTMTGVVFVSRSPMLRGALTALFWMQEPPTAVKVARDLDEALGILRPMFAETKVDAYMASLEDDPTTHGKAIAP